MGRKLWIGIFTALVLVGVALISPVVTGNVVGFDQYASFNIAGMALTFIGLLGLILVSRGEE